MTEIFLDPKKLVGKIDRSTPICVLIFLSNLTRIQVKNSFHLLDTEYLLRFIKVFEEKKPQIIEYPLNKQEDYAKAKHFLNPTCEKEWISLAVEEGLNNILPYLKDEFILPNYEEIVFGNITDRFPTKINLLMSYKICKHFNYFTNFDTTEEEINIAAKNFLFKEEIPKLVLFCQEKIKKLSEKDIIKLNYILSNFEENEEMEDNFEEIVENTEVKLEEKTIENFMTVIRNEPKYLLDKVNPKDNFYAILVAYEKYSFYLGEALNPLKQFKILDKKKLKKYIPEDDYSFFIKYKRNKMWYTDKNWFKELIPLYSQEQLQNYCKNEGSFGQISDLKSFLRERRKVYNFYFGVIPYCNKTLTVVYGKEIKDIDKKQLICFGSIEDNELEYFDLEELIDFFKSSKMFLNPLDRSSLDMYSLNKLKLYLEKNKNEDRKFKELLCVIEDINKIKYLVDMKMKEMLEKTQDKNYKESIRIFFKNATEMAFYMRGWKVQGKNNYPLKSIETNYSSSHQDEVYQNVFTSYKVCLYLSLLL